MAHADAVSVCLLAVGRCLTEILSFPHHRVEVTQLSAALEETTPGEYRVFPEECRGGHENKGQRKKYEEETPGKHDEKLLGGTSGDMNIPAPPTNRR